jgi:hypothetical protein
LDGAGETEIEGRTGSDGEGDGGPFVSGVPSGTSMLTT